MHVKKNIEAIDVSAINHANGHCHLVAMKFICGAETWWPNVIVLCNADTIMALS